MIHLVIASLVLAASPPAASPPATSAPATSAPATSAPAASPPATSPPATSAPAASPLVEPPALFQRDEPSLKSGAQLLNQGDVDGALEAFRRATPKTADERAVVEYDTGSAMFLRAMKSAAPPNAPPGPPSNAAAGPPASDTPSGPDTAALDDARSAFERAYGIAQNRRLKSEAALAAGNVSAQKGDLDEAIAQYRKSLVADPLNARAKTNLRHVLEAKRAQPPPPPQQGDGEKNDDEKDDDQKDDKKKDEQQKGEEPKPGEDKKPGDEKKDEEKKADEKKGDEKKPDEKKPEGEKGEKQKAKQKKEEAKRLLDALRSRERPMTPLEMRGQKKAQPPANGKDW